MGRLPGRGHPVRAAALPARRCEATAERCLQPMRRLAPVHCRARSLVVEHDRRTPGGPARRLADRGRRRPGRRDAAARRRPGARRPRRRTRRWSCWAAVMRRQRRRGRALAAGRPRAAAPRPWPARCRRSASASGAQLLARRPAAGSSRAPTARSTAPSWSPSAHAAATDPLFGELPITPDVMQWHVDAVSRAAARARCCWPARPATRTRRSGSGGWPGGCSSTSRRRPRPLPAWAGGRRGRARRLRRRRDPGPGRRHARRHRRGLAAVRGAVRRDRRRSGARRPARAPCRWPAGRRGAHDDRGPDHRSGRDPGRAGGRDAGVARPHGTDAGCRPDCRRPRLDRVRPGWPGWASATRDGRRAAAPRSALRCGTAAEPAADRRRGAGVRARPGRGSRPRRCAAGRAGRDVPGRRCWPSCATSAELPRPAARRARRSRRARRPPGRASRPMAAAARTTHDLSAGLGRATHRGRGRRRRRPTR